MQTVRITLVILVCTALLGACGLKGPLYLPEEDPVSVPVPGPESSADIDSEDKEKDTEEGGNQIIISI